MAQNVIISIISWLSIHMIKSKLANQPPCQQLLNESSPRLKQVLYTPVLETLSMLLLVVWCRRTFDMTCHVISENYSQLYFVMSTSLLLPAHRPSQLGQTVLCLAS